MDKPPPHPGAVSPTPAYSTENPSTPGRARKSGCGLGCLGALFGIPIGLLLIGYLLIFHTSLPLKLVAGVVQDGLSEDSDQIELRGVGGSLSSGVTVKEMIIEGEYGDSVIEGLEIHYTGLFDSIRNKQLIFEEVSIKQSDFVVGSDFFSETNEGEEEGTEEKTSGDSDPDSQTEGDEGEGLKLFELRKLNFENTRIRSLNEEIDIEIPLIWLAGLKVEGDEFELAELEIISEGVNLELVDAKPEEIAGQLVPFSRKVQGTILPSLHPLVTSEISFTGEFGAMGGRTASRIILCDGAIQQTSIPGGQSIVRFDALTIADFMDTKGLILPERLTTTVRETDKKVDIGKGEFFLGKTNFEVAKQKVDAEDKESAILGTAEVEGHKIEARVRPEKSQMWPPMSVEIESTPPMEITALLSLVYFHQAYNDLMPEEKARIDGLAAGMAGAE